MIKSLLPLSLLALVACDNSVKLDDTSVPIVTEDDTGTPATDDTGTEPTDDTGTVPLDGDGDGVNDEDDCAPEDNTVYPGATEICDGIDQDCDGEADDGSTGTYLDADGDGVGDAAITNVCDAGVVSAGDCNDGDASVYPGAAEVCDSIDQDCNGQVDDGSPGTYLDADGDGVGDAAITNVCDTGVATGGDCDDADNTVYPGATENCDDAVDRNCDGSVSFADGDGDGVAACLDCDDTNASAYPGAAESCNSIDDDCDLEIDEDAVDGLSAFMDADGDGYGGDSITACELPADTVSTDGDCDDDDDTINPDASEICDGVDQNCDGTIDEGVSGTNATYADADGDGYGVGSASYECAPSPGRAVTNGDCDDSDADVSPIADETCNSVDDDCDGSTDEGAVDATTYYLDIDGDTYGSDSSSVTSCTVPAGVAFSGGDCDEGDDAVNPGADELCDAVDNDCDGDVDDDPIDGVTYYPDADRDGWGADAVTACEVPDASSASSGDCDDASADAHPGAAELCNGADDDCNGNIDDAGSTWYNDSDSDGFGDSSTGTGLCTPGTGQTSDGTDCDDTDASVYPDAAEVCDGLDNDCDGSADDGAVALTWYADADGDSYGDPASTLLECSEPSGYVLDATDCDDEDGAINPGATEVCDGADNNCDSITDPDFFNSSLDSAESSWALNGDAYHNLDDSDGFFRLTEEEVDMVGTAWFTTPVPTDRLHVSFTLLSNEDVSGDINGEGMTLTFMDGTDTTVVGAGTTQLGAGGLSGYAVEIDEVTYGSSWGGSYPYTDRHVGVTELSAFTALDTEDVDDDYLNDVEVEVDVYFDRGDISVYLDGDLMLSYTISGYSTDTVTIGFTAATGTYVSYWYDERISSYDVDDVVIACE